MLKGGGGSHRFKQDCLKRGTHGHHHSCSLLTWNNEKRSALYVYLSPTDILFEQTILKKSRLPESRPSFWSQYHQFRVLYKTPYLEINWVFVYVFCTRHLILALRSGSLLLFIIPLQSSREVDLHFCWVSTSSTTPLPNQMPHHLLRYKSHTHSEREREKVSQTPLSLLLHVLSFHMHVVSCP